MDVRSFKIANLLLDNPENEAVLEFTLIGPTLEFTSATIIAITGGDFQPTINGEPAPMYTAIYMNKGDILKFGSARTGSRSKRLPGMLFSSSMGQELKFLCF
jgi:allophanate hydrolase subunit 2